MRDWQEDVRRFNTKLGGYLGNMKTPVPPEVIKLKKDLIEEEHNEFQDAIDSGNHAHIAKEAADLIYVVLGATLAYGIDLNPIWDAVQASNMKKQGGGNRADGKIMKPPGWKAPAIAGLLYAQSLRELDNEHLLKLKTLQEPLTQEEQDLIAQRIQFHEYQFQVLEEIAKAEEETEKNDKI